MNRETARLLEQHFDTAFDAPDGIKKLRELILTLAMQGKLVPQDPNDKPASELLKEIEAEKKRLIKEGKIKKQKPLPPIKPEEIPYEIPKSWQWVQLGDLVSIQTGKKDVNQGAEKGQFPFFSCAAEPLRSDEYSFDCEALLMPGNGANVGLVTYYSGKFEAYQRTYVLNNFLKILPHFLEKSLKTLFLKSIEGRQYGSAINYIKLGNLTNFLVPLSPIAEQQRIVEKIDALMARVDELERLRKEREEKRLKIHKAAIDGLLSAKSDADFAAAWRFITGKFNSLYSVKENVAELRKAILQLAVMGKLVPQDPSDQPASELLKEIEAEKKRLIKEGKIKPSKPLPPIKPEDIPFEIPIGWQWRRLQDLFSLITDGDHQAPPKSDSGIPFLVIGNLNTGHVDFSGCRFVPKKYFDDLDWTKKPKQNDILFTVTGSYGIPILVKKCNDFCVQRHVAIFKSLLLTPTQFIVRFLNSQFAKSYSDSIATGIAQKTVPLNGLRQMYIPVPPLNEQQRIVEKIDALMALCDKLEQNLAAATEKQTGLLNSLMAKV